MRAKYSLEKPALYFAHHALRGRFLCIGFGTIDGGFVHVQDRFVHETQHVAVVLSTDADCTVGIGSERQNATLHLNKTVNRRPRQFRYTGITWEVDKREWTKEPGLVICRTGTAMMLAPAR